MCCRIALGIGYVPFFWLSLACSFTDFYSEWVPKHLLYVCDMPMIFFVGY